jgi:ribosomal protein L37AE/L43A
MISRSWRRFIRGGVCRHFSRRASKRLNGGVGRFFGCTFCESRSRRRFTGTGSGMWTCPAASQVICGFVSLSTGFAVLTDVGAAVA